jgi:DNA-binding response OmpR family regulator
MAQGKILIVEPDDDIHNMLNKYLTGFGLDVETIATGTDVALKLKEFIPDVIVLATEEKMPLDDALYQQIPSNPLTSNTEVIFLCQPKQAIRRNMILDAYRDDTFIEKPFDVEELQLRLWQSIRRSKLDNTI